MLSKLPSKTAGMDFRAVLAVSCTFCLEKTHSIALNVFFAYDVEEGGDGGGEEGEE